MAPAGRPDHDALHHRLFGDPGVVAQLPRGFVDASLLDGLDLDRMERLNAKFHADTGQRREADMIWRIPRRDGEDSYLVLLLEFQSTSDPYMALRVLTYAALLWQHLVSERRLAAGGKLPPLLPVVLYNGAARWSAPLATRDLVAVLEGSPLWPWQPELRYYVIDSGRFSDAELAARDGLPALWFRLEGAPDPSSAVGVADAVLAWLASHPEYGSARAVFAEMLGAIMAPLGKGIRMPDDLMEMRNMLASRAEQWKQAWREEGLREGRQEGLREGRQEGLREGLREGQREGEAALLLRLLERRFGALPDWASTRVRAADTAVLEEWSLLVLDAGSLEDVLGQRQA